jgi:hypothetical protein
MSFFLLSVGPLEAHESLGDVDQIGLESASDDLAQGFLAYESEVVRWWTSPQSPLTEPEYLVVRELPEEDLIERTLERSGLRLLGWQRLVVTDRYPDLLGIGDSDLDDILPTEFPETLRIEPQDLADPGGVRASLDPDIEVYPCCGGISAHRRRCRYAG